MVVGGWWFCLKLEAGSLKLSSRPAGRLSPKANGDSADASLRRDSDGDGLTDLVEKRLGTDAKVPDTDGDGLDGEGPLELWGMPWTQRLLPDATRFFPGLAATTARLQANGEHKLELDLDEHAPGAAMPRAAAGPIVLLTRDSGGPTRAEWLSPLSAPTEIETLWPWESGWTPAHERTAARLLDQGVLRLHLNSTPDEAVTALEAALEPAAAR